MNIETWRAMLERRGYTDVLIEQRGEQIFYSIGGIRGIRGAQSFERMTYRMLRKEIEIQLGHGMEFVRHRCGQPLLRAKAGFTSHDSFHPVQHPLFHPEYHSIPLRPHSTPLTICPGCYDELNPGSIRRIKDPEHTPRERGLQLRIS